MEHCLKSFEEPQHQNAMMSMYNQWAITPKRKTAKAFATYQKQFKRGFLASCTGTKKLILVPTNKPAKNIKFCTTHVNNSESKEKIKTEYKGYAKDAARNKTKKIKYADFEKMVMVNAMKLCTGQLKEKLVKV
jgi:hypothetical protein